MLPDFQIELAVLLERFGVCPLSTNHPTLDYLLPMGKCDQLSF